MDEHPINRKQFLTNVGKACVCSCVYTMATGISSIMAEDSTKQITQPVEGSEAKKPRSQERIEFTEKWAVRFFNVMDENLDEPSRRKVMMANGKACLLATQKENNQQPRKEPVTLERFAAWVEKSGSQIYKVEGNVIYVQYNAPAQTGSATQKSNCGCPMVETNPSGLSHTYCLCSLGFVKEEHEQMFKRPVNVELMGSILKGDPSCKFKITVS